MSALLETAIGVVFLFLVVSLLVTAFTELVASWTRWRSGNLWKGLRAMIGSDATAKLLAHASIETLKVPATLPRLSKIGIGNFRLAPRIEGPAYVSTQTFATALLDLVLEPQKTLESALQNIRSVSTALGPLTDANAAAEVLTKLAGSMPASQILDPVKQQITKWAAELKAGTVTPKELADQIKNLSEAAQAVGASSLAADIAALQQVDQRVKNVLLTLARKSGGDIDKLRKEVEGWFDAMMERLSGWYKRKIQALSFCSALVLALWMDIDTVRVARVLWADSSLRQAIVAEAEATVQNPPAGVDASPRTETKEGVALSVRREVTGGETVAIDIKGDGKIDRTARLTTPAPGGAAPAEGGTCTMKAGTPQCTLTLQTQTVSVATNLKIGVSVESGTPVTSVTLESTVTLLPSPQERIAYWQGRMQALDLPVGWCNVETGATDRRWWCAGETVWEIGGPFRLPQRDYVYVGWLLTALAASLGAPFWFDLLKKVVNVRSSGVVDAAAGKPGQTQTGTSK